MRNVKLLLMFFLVMLVDSSAATFGKKGNTTPASATEKSYEKVLSTADLQRLKAVISNIKQYYYKSTNDSMLFVNAIRGMLTGLDPHSDYLDVGDLKDLEMMTLGKFGGIGVEIIPDQGAIRVVSPLDDTPAYKAGIKAGDYIVQINNKFVRDMSLRDAARMMRGPKGTVLNLTIIRKNQHKPLLFKLRREIIKFKTVKERILEPGYGYIRLAGFQETTEKDMVRAVRRLQKLSQGGLKGLILDVRNNPGGLFESAVDIADDFLDAKILKNNRLIVYANGQGNETQLTANATPGELLPNTPLVVLIDEGSASSSEILAGALQDHKRAIVVGTRSFGKGSIQTLIPIDKNSAIKLTTALYYTPLGRSIQAKGIEPDIVVEDMLLSKKYQEEHNSIPRIDESALVDHIQDQDNDSNVGGVNDDGDSAKINDNSSDDKTNELGSSKKDRNKKQKKLASPRPEAGLAYKDYQLYEALHILKSQNITRSKDD